MPSATWPSTHTIDAAMSWEAATFNIECVHEAGVRLIAVTGELDMATAPQLQAHLRDASKGEGAVLADLCAVDFIDSTGVRTLLECHQSITRQGRRFAVSSVDGGAPAQIIKLTGLNAVIEHYCDRASALHALRQAG